MSEGRPKAALTRCFLNERGNGGRVGQRPVSLCPPVPGVDSAGPSSNGLAALHLQSPSKHVTQNRTTSFLW
jgi:hypothetical protein